MSLSDRLSRIIGAEKPKAVSKDISKLDQHIKGEWTNIGKMKVFQVESSVTFSPSSLKLEKISQVLGLPVPDPYKMLFFDTETTGLAGGTGTYAFMVGIGFLAGSRFLVIQLFMPGFADEPALLDVLSKIADEHTHLVSFNGKMFDLPLLSTRFTLSRIEDTLKGKPHLDLLHLSRPVWKRRLDSCSLKSLEVNVLGHDRDGDIDGALIPEIYFNWLRTGDPAQIAQVFEHNRQDVASMAKLLEVLGSIYENPESPSFEHPSELLGLARFVGNRGHHMLAQSMLVKAVDSTDLALRDEALSQLGKMHKKLGDHDNAVECFSKISSNTQFSSDALCQLAKHYEHRAKDIDRALECTNKAMEIGRNRYVITGQTQDMTELRKRADRLVSKKLRKNKRSSVSE